jgi:hypothetical protein
MDDANYERDRAAAEDDGTAIPEATGDAPPHDLYHAARDLADRIGPGLAEKWQEIGLAGDDPVRWGQLDVARAASYLRAADPDGFARLTAAHPWLEADAGEAHHDALGALADSIVDHA